MFRVYLISHVRVTENELYKMNSMINQGIDVEKRKIYVIIYNSKDIYF